MPTGNPNSQNVAPLSSTEVAARPQPPQQLKLWPPPGIDLDHFDQMKYFPAPYGGHCAAIALGLHRLTGWPLYVIPGHALIRSPRGYLDLRGFHGLDCDEGVPQNWSAERLESDYVERAADERVQALARRGLEMAIPVAEAILARYFPNGWDRIPQQLELNLNMVEWEPF